MADVTAPPVTHDTATGELLERSQCLLDRSAVLQHEAAALTALVRRLLINPHIPLPLFKIAPYL